MATTPQMERGNLIREFWDCVRATVIEEYRRPTEIADRSIELYRQELDRREIGDIGGYECC